MCNSAAEIKKLGLPHALAEAKSDIILVIARELLAATQTADLKNAGEIDDIWKPDIGFKLKPKRL